MLMPKKTKFRKVHRGRRAGQAKGQTSVQFGDYGLKALEAGWITNRQIEAARIAMTRKIKRGGKVWIYRGDILPDQRRMMKEMPAPEPFMPRQGGRPGGGRSDDRPRRDGDRRGGGGGGRGGDRRGRGPR